MWVKVYLFYTIDVDKTFFFFYICMYVYLYNSLYVYMNYSHFYIIVRAVHSLCVLHSNKNGKKCKKKIQKRKTTKNHPNWPHWNKIFAKIYPFIYLSNWTTKLPWTFFSNLISYMFIMFVYKVNKDFICSPFSFHLLCEQVFLCVCVCLQQNVCSTLLFFTPQCLS